MNSLPRHTVLSLLLASALAGTTRAQSPTLIRDFDPSSVLSPGHANPDGFTRFRGETFFAATTIARGTELYKISGNTGLPVLIKDIVPGPDSSSPGPFATFGLRLYFGTGNELWSSDGSEHDTSSVVAVGSPIVQVAGGSGSLYFRTAAGEIFASNGGAAGTQNITPPGIRVEEDFVLAAGSVYFLSQVATRAQLWTASGTSAPARLVTGKILRGQELAVVGNRVLVTNLTATGLQLWSSDGTDPGTLLLPTPRVRRTRLPPEPRVSLHRDRELDRHPVPNGRHRARNADHLSPPQRGRFHPRGRRGPTRILLFSYRRPLRHRRHRVRHHTDL